MNRGRGMGERKETKKRRGFFFLGEGQEEKERKEGRRRNCTESFGPVVEVGRNPPSSQSEQVPALGPAASSSRATSRGALVVSTGVMPGCRGRKNGNEERERGRAGSRRYQMSVRMECCFSVPSGCVARWIASWGPCFSG